MKKIASLFFFLTLYLFATTQTKQVWSRVKLLIDQSELPKLIEKGLDIGHVHIEADGFITVLEAQELAFLHSQQVAYEVIVKDELAHFLEKNTNADFYATEKSNYRNNVNTSCQSIDSKIKTPENFKEGSMGGFLTYVEMIAQLDSMYKKFPQLISPKKVIGKSYELRNIYSVKISNNPNTDEAEAEILYSAMNHSREPTAMHQMIFYMWYLLENYETNQEIKNLVDNRELFFVPIVNPDGYVYNQTIAPNGGGMWRTNRHRNSDGTIGVDLNRNYSVGWGANDSGSSPIPGSSTYRGTAPFSEPESSAIRDFSLSRDFNIVMDYHAFGNLMIQPWSNPDAEAMEESEANIFKKYGKEFTQFNCYKPGTDRETVGYVTNGVSYDWHFGRARNDNKKTYAWIPEVGKSNHGFWPTKDLIIPLGKENLYQNIKAAELTGAFAVANFEQNLSLTTINEELKLTIQRLGLEDDEIILEWEENNYLQFSNNTYVIPKGTLAAPLSEIDLAIPFQVITDLPNAMPIKLAFTLKTGGLEIPYQIEFIWKADLIFEDNMENNFSDNWTTDGQWNFVEDPTYSLNKVLTDSPNGNYIDNLDYMAMLKNPLNLSESKNAFLVFKIKYDIEHCVDQLFVEIGEYDQNGLAINFEPLCGNLSIFQDINYSRGKPSITRKNENWQQAIFPLNDYIGKNNLALRFRLDVNHFINEDGVYIDELQVLSSKGVGPLAMDLVDFEATLNSKNEVLLTWETTSEIDNDFFVIQKSKDGLHFEKIGKQKSKGNTNNTNVYQFIDKNPFSPISYYRLKIVEYDASFDFSKNIVINVDQPFRIKNIFPNPAQDFITIEFQSEVEKEIPYTIYNLLGQQVKSGMFDLIKNESLQQIDLADLSQGAYVLSVFSFQSSAFSGQFSVFSF